MRVEEKIENLKVLRKLNKEFRVFYLFQISQIQTNYLNNAVKINSHIIYPCYVDSVVAYRFAIRA